MYIKQIKKIGSFILTLLVIMIGIGFTIEYSSVCPGYSLILVNEEISEYYAPPCIMNYGYDKIEDIYLFARENNLHVYTMKELKGKKIRPNPACRDRGGFSEDGRSILGAYLEDLGLLPELKKKWNTNGTWNDF
jgi:hypothetical protein